MQLDDLLGIKNPEESTELFNKMAQLYILEDIDALYIWMGQHTYQEIKVSIC